MIRKHTFDHFLLLFGFHLMFPALALDKGKGAKQAVIVDFTVLKPAYLPVGHRTAGESSVSLHGTHLPRSEAQHPPARGPNAASSLAVWLTAHGFYICTRCLFKRLSKYPHSGLHLASLPAKPRIFTVWPRREKSNDLCYRVPGAFTLRPAQLMGRAFHFKVAVLVVKAFIV